LEAAGSTESSVNFYQSVWHLIPGDENVKSYGHENFKPCIQAYRKSITVIIE
jgi:hypothetical protein